MKLMRFIIITVIALLILSGLNYFLQKQFVDFFMKLGWEPIAGFVSGSWWNSLPAVILTGGIIIAVQQIYELKKSTNAQITMELFRELRGDKTLERLRFIYSLKLERGTLLNLSKKDTESIDYVLDRLTMLGHLVDKGIIDKTLAIEGFSGPAVLRCWHQLFYYIEHSRKQRGYYVENYEAFANRCTEYFKSAHIQITFSNKYEDIENLVTELDEDKERRPRNLKQIRKDRKKIYK